MAFTSIGYDGSVNERQWAELVPSVGSSTYGVKGAGDLKVTAVPGQPSVVSIAPGSAWGHGVLDTQTTNTTVACDPITSGSRWDLIALRRDWQPLAGGPTAAVAVTGSSDKVLPGNRKQTPGVQDDQPLALVQWTAGQTQPTAIVDLRCWAGNGGLVASDTLALSYLGKLGATVIIAGAEWNYVVGANDVPSWVRSNEVGKLPLFGTGAPLAGSLPSGLAPNFLVQAGTFVGKTDGAGYTRLYWPKPFPNGLLTVSLTNADDWVTGYVAFANIAGRPDVFGSAGYGNQTEVVYALQGVSGAGGNFSKIPYRDHRVNYVAIGW